MKWTSLLGAALTLFSAIDSTNAGIVSPCGAGKSSGCAESYQPDRCLPTIVRPSTSTIYNYQRRNSFLKASCSAPTSICAPASCCAPAICCAPVGQAGCANTCCAPCENTCCAPTECGQGTYCVPVQESSCTVPSECFVSGDACAEGGGCGTASCPEIATLIHKSKTECYATARRSAIHKLGDRYDCCDHPEIMSAFIYALNDSDERVRAEAADEIGDQVRRNRCICGMPVIRALRCSLADCDRNVRRQAEQALKASGYAITSGSRSGSDYHFTGELCPATETITIPHADETLMPPPIPQEPTSYPGESTNHRQFLPMPADSTSVEIFESMTVSQEITIDNVTGFPEPSKPTGVRRVSATKTIENEKPFGFGR